MKLNAVCTTYFIYNFIKTTFTFECNRFASVCETSLEIKHRLTMMKPKGDSSFPLSEEAVFPNGGNIYRYDVTNTSGAALLDSTDVILADGWETPRLVVVANNTMPGPPIIVYEGQIIRVKVINKLKSEQVSIHWHGVPQEGYPYMDGTPFLTQCPILTGQTFVYEFRVKYKGTYWYHSHEGHQRSKGLFGAFVIRENKTLEMEEHLMSIQDWNHNHDADMDDAKIIFGPYENRLMLPDPWDIHVHSGLINGRGRYWDPSTNQHNGAPLEIYNVQGGRHYRFRVINTGAEYPWTLSIDNHYLTLVATDGFDIEPKVADSFMISAGERFDFVLTADQSVNNYWIRAKSIENSVSHLAEAILRYVGAPDEEPSSDQKNCTADNKCLQVNCFHRYFPEDKFTDCLPIDKLNLKANDDVALVITKGKFKEYFLKFGFPGSKATFGAINGRRFIFPTRTVLAEPYNDFPCELEDCGEQKVCECSYRLHVDHMDTVQLVFISMGSAQGFPHPIHLHGHSFHVLKIGYGAYDNKTGKILNENFDIDCRGGTDRPNSYCNNATWSNSSWQNGHIPGVDLQKPIRKDTVFVPPGGYVVTRFKANNPGVWFLHCHIGVHANDGMALIINESFPHHPLPPVGFPTCSSYPDYKPMESLPVTTTGTDSSSDKICKDSCRNDNQYDLQVPIGVLCGVILLEFACLIWCWVNSIKDQSSKHKEEGQINPNFINHNET